jgi:hypothetical protein
MVRKSRKGIVGKALPTMCKRYRIGEGIDFIKEKLKMEGKIDED